MKHLFIAIGAGLLLASCGPKIDEYSLDEETSTLWWRGEENAEHFHTGHIAITEGAMTTEDGTPISGQFVIDANSIIAETEGYPAEKLAYLTGHLKDTAFLFTAKYPEVKVKTGKYENGKLNTTITVLGVDLVQDIPVNVTKTEKGLNLKGDFSVDFADSKMIYLTEVDPETGKPGAKSEMQFKLDLNLKKK